MKLHDKVRLFESLERIRLFESLCSQYNLNCIALSYAIHIGPAREPFIITQTHGLDILSMNRCQMEDFVLECALKEMGNV